MKKMLVLLLLVSLVASAAMAQDEGSSMVIGARAGYSISPDQIFFGAHTDLGQLVGPMRLVPNIEVGFGDNLTLICINGDLLYDIEDTPWAVGGELGINHYSWDTGDWGNIPGVDIDSSNTELGVSALGNYRLQMSNGKTLLLEGKLGLTNSPDFKFTVGYNFF